MTKTAFNIDRDNLEISSKRIYSASPAQLFAAYTDPIQVAKWWVPSTYSIIVERLDVRLGGSWRFIETEPNGTTYAWSGIYQELEPPNKLVTTFVFEPTPGHVHIGTVLFSQLANGETELFETLKFLNTEDLEYIVGMGMEVRRTESLDRLEAMIESL